MTKSAIWDRSKDSAARTCGDNNTECNASACVVQLRRILPRQGEHLTARSGAGRAPPASTSYRTRTALLLASGEHLRREARAQLHARARARIAQSGLSSQVRPSRHVATAARCAPQQRAAASPQLRAVASPLRGTSRWRAPRCAPAEALCAVASRHAKRLFALRVTTQAPHHDGA